MLYIEELQLSLIDLCICRLGNSDKIIDRQTSAPSGYVSSTSPIVIKRVQIRKEEPTSSSAPMNEIKKPSFETATATATIKINPPQTRTARIKINVVKPEENKENVIKPTEIKLSQDFKRMDDPKVNVDKVKLSLI